MQEVTKAVRLRIAAAAISGIEEVPVESVPNEIWVCDFLHTYDLFFRALFVFLIIELAFRRAVYAALTRNPSGA